MNRPPDFNRLARIYRWLEYFSFGPYLWRCRLHFLPDLLHCKRALALGDGDGRFTARLLGVNSQIQIHAIDVSPRMIAALEHAAAPHQSRLTTEIADLRKWHPSPGERYDLIVTHFFLDCLSSEEVGSLIPRISPNLAPHALWLVSEFAIPKSQYGRFIASPLVAFLYRAFGLLTKLRQQCLPDYGQALRAGGWVLQSEHAHLGGLLVSQLWEQCLPQR
jgi:SAM-dependent methyltransferase